MGERRSMVASMVDMMNVSAQVTKRIRRVVSKQKKRFTEDGFDLDLSYITPRIIAMGFPSSGTEAVYRNPRQEVKRFFNQRHKGHHMIYNLCSEKEYNITKHFEKVERFPFDDHMPCALGVIARFCGSVDLYLAEDERNVIAVHCKAGKGRTGLLIACYLLHSGVVRTAQEALEWFARERTMDNKGVTIPSQIRYVHYYEQLLKSDVVTTYTYQITHIRFVTVPNFDASITGGGCEPYVKVRVMVQDGHNNIVWKPKLHFNQLDVIEKAKKFRTSERFVDLDLSDQDVYVRGDVQLAFYGQDKYSHGGDKMLHLWFNTTFVERNCLIFDKQRLDKCHKDKNCHTFSEDFRVQVFLKRVAGQNFVVGDHADSDDEAHILSDEEADVFLEEEEEEEDETGEF